MVWHKSQRKGQLVNIVPPHPGADMMAGCFPCLRDGGAVVVDVVGVASTFSTFCLFARRGGVAFTGS